MNTIGEIVTKMQRKGGTKGTRLEFYGGGKEGGSRINWGLVVLASLPTPSDVEWRIGIRALKGLTPVSKTTRYR